MLVHYVQPADLGSLMQTNKAFRKLLGDADTFPLIAENRAQYEEELQMRRRQRRAKRQDNVKKGWNWFGCWLLFSIPALLLFIGFVITANANAGFDPTELWQEGKNENTFDC